VIFLKSKTCLSKQFRARCKDDYSSEQLEVWTSSIKDTPRWHDKIESQYFIVAELNEIIVGFASLDNNDYLDLLFVQKEYQRRGIASKLYSEIEKEAVQRKISILNASVSITAKYFFAGKGFKTVKENRNIRKGVEIINYHMEKTISFSSDA